MTGVDANTGFGARFEAELYRNGKLVADNPKPKSRYLVIKGKGRISVIELKPKEKNNED